MSGSLNSVRQRRFGLAPSSEALFLRSIVRTRLQFIVLTLVAIEEKNLLCVLSFRHRHSCCQAWPLGSLKSVHCVFFKRLGSSCEVNRQCFTVLNEWAARPFVLPVCRSLCIKFLTAIAAAPRKGRSKYNDRHGVGGSHVNNAHRSAREVGATSGYQKICNWCWP
jgi:hypothetical protein